MKKFHLGIIGAGTVGKALVEIILKESFHIQEKYGFIINIHSIATRTPSRISSIANCPVSTDWKEITENPEIDLVVELIGGTTTAWEIAESALNHQKTFITANKALLYEKGDLVFQLAKKNKVEVGFEASVGGAIPIIRTLKTSLSPNHFESIAGILNGTTNFILSKMELENLDYKDALRIAQELGFAEADPSFDVEGIDVSHKIAILARLAFGRSVQIQSVTGITKISSLDIQCASSMGYRIKLLGMARLVHNQIHAKVQPVLLPISHPMASVLYEKNAVFYRTSYSGEGMLTGLGAGGVPTASAVLADILYYASRREFVMKNPEMAEVNLFPASDNLQMIEEENRYYIRFTTVDRPGVLGYISGILGNFKISISSVVQKESIEDSPTAVFITTHKANNQAIQKALGQIDQNKEIIRESSLALPIMENL